MAATATTIGLEGDELQTILAEQHSELMAAKALDSDLDLAFRLQLQEALAASAALQPSSSSPSASASALPDAESVADEFKFAALQAEELERFDRERRDLEQCQNEMRRTLIDLNRRVHDQHFAREIESVTDDVWEDEGDYIERPFGEGCSSSSDVNFRLYFKGLVSEESIGGAKVRLVGVGIAICDPMDNLVFEQRKPVVIDGMNRLIGEIRALIEGLTAALDLDLKRIIFYCDYYPLFKYITGKWVPKQRKIATLLNQVSILQRKFTSCDVYLVARHEIKFAFKLARDAIDSHVNKPAELRHIDSLRETCVICLEDTEFGKMFSVTGCHHRFCLSCMKQHIEVKLLHGMDPKCPHEGCNVLITLENCGKFLAPKLIEIMSERVKERSIPAMERVYCPFPKCSALMSKSEALEYAKKFGGGERTGARECMKCHRLFCINCKVTWHPNMSCFEYRRLHPNPSTEDGKLKSLATRNLWRQCVKCNHMIELAEGCYHMTCRCGYEFCYTCGAEWRNKKATCGCPLWHEDHILHDQQQQHGRGLYEDEDDDEDEDYYTDSDTDYYWR